MRKFIAVALLLALSSADAFAQRGGGGGRGGGAAQTPPMTAQELAALRAQLIAALQAQPATAPQPFVRNGPPTDPVILKMWEEGWTNGQAGKLLQVLSDS